MITWETDTNAHDSGIAVFDSRESRTEAVEWLTYLGYRYFTEYQDANGPGLSYAWRCGPQVRPSRRERLPSVQRARRDERARSAFQRSLFRNPGYDLVNDPVRESRYA